MCSLHFQSNKISHEFLDLRIHLSMRSLANFERFDIDHFPSAIYFIIFHHFTFYFESSMEGYNGFVKLVNYLFVRTERPQFRNNSTLKIQGLVLE